VTLTAAEVAERWLPAFLAGERAAAELYADDVTIWHNIGERTERLEKPPSHARAKAALPDLHQEDVRLRAGHDHFVLQLTAVATGPDGARVRVPSCLVVTVEAGRITRFDEYADSAAAAALLAVLHGNDQD
jgi:ketosteroid isomerase-like protein